MWKDFFYFSKRERQGILILIAVIVGIFTGKFLFTPKVSSGKESEEILSSQTQHGGEAQSPDKQGLVYEKTRGQNHRDVHFKRQPVQVEKRTYYRQPEKIVELPRKSEYSQKEKFPEGTVIELNACDTNQLMKIPGIGTAFAKRITSYGKILGGYYRLQQLQEVYGMYEELYDKITPFLKIDTGLIRPIPANSVSLDKLKSHPYLNFYQAKTIVEIRKKKGKINSMNELMLLEEFSEKDIERIQYYLSFE
jgi:DNA uptake protein ComE-like DNA-binding protein